MKIVVFGLTISSSWGNGHATLWRGLCAALARRGHYVVFYEKDVPYYARHRDLHALPDGRLELYEEWTDVHRRAAGDLVDAYVAIVTSFCADGIRASELVLEIPSSAKIFYDLDTPVTLAAVQAGTPLSYVGARGFAGFDLVLSFTGGRAVEALQRQLSAARVEPLFGHVDPSVHRPVVAEPEFRCALSYLGTYSADRQQQLDELFLEPARRAKHERFVLGGVAFPESTDWPANVVRLSHVTPARHAAFFCSSRLTLSVTRSTMARYGYCPSGRLFEAAACGAPVLSDWFEGLETFFEPGKEILVARSKHDVLQALQASDAELEAVAKAGRARVLSEHTSDHRAIELERVLSRLAAQRTTRLSGAYSGQLGAS
jgi:spore maturation protein CgeB